MMLESADDDVKSWTSQMLDARGIKPKLNRAMRESDSDDDLYDPRSISSRTSSVPVATVMVRGRGGARACLQNRR